VCDSVFVTFATEIAKSTAFPHTADRSGYEMPSQATYGEGARASGDVVVCECVCECD
jgi:hypothetical protein